MKTRKDKATSKVTCLSDEIVDDQNNQHYLPETMYKTRHKHTTIFIAENICSLIVEVSPFFRQSAKCLPLINDLVNTIHGIYLLVQRIINLLCIIQFFFNYKNNQSSFVVSLYLLNLTHPDLVEKYFSTLRNHWFRVASSLRFSLCIKHCTPLSSGKIFHHLLIIVIE